MLVAIEGMDGVGKTTVAKYIKDKYNYKFIEKPLHYFYNDGPEKKYEDLMKVANRLYDINDMVIKSWYFSLGNIYCARMFKNENVVVDRHFVSNYYWNADEECDKLFELLINLCGAPDLTILLYATPKTRMKRLQERDANDSDLDDEDKKDDGFKRMVYFLEKFNLPYTVVNTENKDLFEVEQEISAIMEKLKTKTLKLENKNEY